MKNFYFACVVSENGKNYAHILKIPVGANLLTKIKNRSFDVVHLCETKAQAEWLVTHWNACFKVNGSYMFSDPPTF